ncbi:4-alpha-glucanotransferase [Ruminococcus sp.]|uniref:4-alpha-glucanotransferase n=1 Tax=Ruminococcus sp. TaxID=41978 RepID=UPI0015B92E51|nr:4-alpha-glucanotransferase [Ruminococcus sp.]MEE0740587.1 4-alpha-glucanotransferase [Ruminococcus sp.]
MLTDRLSGILLHPTSFPSRYGIGDLGTEAYNFIDFLYESNQKLWQILPLGSVNDSYSPYQSTSAFAGNFLLISLEKLVDEGLLNNSDLEELEFVNHNINYEEAKKIKSPLLHKAYDNFYLKGKFSDYNAFCKENSYWLEDYSLFTAINEYITDNEDNNAELSQYISNLDKNKYIDEYCGGLSWNAWPSEYYYNSEFIDKIKDRLKERIEFHKFLQYIFLKQWFQLKAYANARDIKIIGDVPMYMPLHSADVWANPNLFLLDNEFKPIYIAGCAPDDGCPNGQSFGNCVYDWNVHKESNYKWWINRLKFALKTADMIRLDHFTGYQSYWVIPINEKNPANGFMCKTNGKDFFDIILKEISDSLIIVEDIGSIKKEVIDLRDSLGFPSMKIMQFEKNNFRNNVNLPHNFTDSNCVLYTGTHDNNTILGWYKELDDETKEIVNEITQEEDINWGLIKYAFSSIAKFVIVPLQDILGLDERYRMNIPGVVNGSWRFQYDKDMLTEEIKKKLKRITYLYNR